MTQAHFLLLPMVCSHPIFYSGWGYVTAELQYEMVLYELPSMIFDWLIHLSYDLLEVYCYWVVGVEIEFIR